MAGLLNAAVAGDSTVLRGFLDLYVGGNSSHRNQQNIVEELLNLSNLRRQNHDNMHSTRSQINNIDSYDDSNYSENNFFDGYDGILDEGNGIGSGSGNRNYNNNFSRGHSLPTRLGGPTAVQRDRIRRLTGSAPTNVTAVFPTPSLYHQTHTRFSFPGFQPPQSQLAQHVGGRSSSQAIDLCDDDTGFSVLSSSFPSRRPPTFGQGQGQGEGQEGVPSVFGRNGTSNINSTNRLPVDLTDDVIDLREDSLLVEDRTSPGKHSDEESSALGDLWAVSNTSSFSSSSSTSSSTSTLSSSSFLSSSSSSATISPDITSSSSSSSSSSASVAIPNHTSLPLPLDTSSSEYSSNSPQEHSSNLSISHDPFNTNTFASSSSSSSSSILQFHPLEESIENALEHSVDQFLGHSGERSSLKVDDFGERSSEKIISEKEEECMVKESTCEQCSENAEEASC